jgi:diguanylate cyclase
MKMNRVKIIILIIFSIVVISLTFNSKYTSLIGEFESTAESKTALVNEHIRISINFIEGITIAGNSYFRHKNYTGSDLMQYLEYDPDTDSYDLDAVKGTPYEKIVGNLTGDGIIPDNETVRDELNLALLFNEYFNVFYSRLDDIAWLYYTSENNFINIFPWTSSSEFRFDEALKKEVFYTFLTPENDPSREYRWTPVYLDHAGKGFMVTLSSPIYNGDIFKGVVSVDFTNKQLSDLLVSKYDSFLADTANTVVATNIDITDADGVITLNMLMDDFPAEKAKVEMAADDTVQRVGNDFIYLHNFDDAPWKLIFVVPMWQIIGRSLFFSLPVLFICVLLFFTVYEDEKRKKTEVLLKESIIEIRSYQNFLENAAKYDFLTNTVNRRGLKEITDKKAVLDIPDRKPFSFIMCDIDHFKQFNDTYGHAAGDKVLKEIAVLIQKSINSSDVVCRWGGEEFVIMLLGKTCGDSMAIAEDIRKKIESAAIPWENATELRTTMTFGIAEYDYTGSIEECIKRADDALYAGKANGRNRVVCYKDIETL